jgi:rare lipoprotein A (peptidoglycan hydrolase)
MRTRRWRWVVVTVLATGRSARCYVNDYGPAASTGRLIVVSHGVAGQFGFAGRGTARVQVVDEGKLRNGVSQECRLSEVQRTSPKQTLESYFDPMQSFQTNDTPTQL